ncbi:MAG: YmdB family metallophosphoesterase [Treponema sp.]|jgi:metallophosphoesterase (TIGR00282 family)|nr:YmdB family metallophosphoesterase [Treponema sp.]
MKIFYVAELVGKAGVFTLKKAINELKSRYNWDFLIVNADGATSGNGLGYNHAIYIHKLGADVITLGDCCFHKKDLTENIGKMHFVLRPNNFNPQSPGHGSFVFKKGNKKIAVVVFMGQNGFNRLHANNSFVGLGSMLENLQRQTPYVLVDFHAQASGEKKTFFAAVDGLCSAVIGSHTRVQTADETILPGGTAVISCAGRTGSQQSVGGCEINSRINEYLSGIPDWTRDAWEDLELQGVYLDIGKDGKAQAIERVRLKVNR